MRCIVFMVAAIVSLASAAQGQVVLQVGDLQLVADPSVTPMTTAQDMNQDGFGATPSPAIEGAFGIPAGVTPGISFVALRVWFFERMVAGRPVWRPAGGSVQFQGLSGPLPALGLPGGLMLYNFRATGVGAFPIAARVCIDYHTPGCGGEFGGDICRACFSYVENGAMPPLAGGVGPGITSPAFRVNFGQPPAGVNVNFLNAPPGDPSGFSAPQGRADDIGVLDFNVAYQYNAGRNSRISTESFVLQYNAELDEDVWEPAQGDETDIVETTPDNDFEYQGVGEGTVYSLDCPLTGETVDEAVAGLLVDYRDYLGFMRRDFVLWSTTGARRCVIRDVHDQNDPRIFNALYNGCGNSWDCDAPPPVRGSTFSPPTLGGGSFDIPILDGGSFNPPTLGGGSFNPPTLDGGSFNPPTLDGGSFNPPTLGGGSFDPTTGLDGGSFNSPTIDGAIIDGNTIDGTFTGTGIGGTVADGTAFGGSSWDGGGLDGTGMDGGGGPCAYGFWYCFDTDNDGTNDECRYYYCDCDGNCWVCDSDGICEPLEPDGPLIETEVDEPIRVPVSPRPPTKGIPGPGIRIEETPLEFTK